MVKVGLEVHGYILMEQSKKKLFCECSIVESETLNTKIVSK